MSRWMVVVVLSFVALACQPKDERPGLALSGQHAPELVEDWGFTDDAEEIAIQTRTWYGVPHSTTIWCVQVDGHLYLGSYGWADDPEEEHKYWERNVLRRPEARLGIDGKLYDVTVESVSADETELLEALDAAYNAKYDMVDVFGEDLPNWWYYRVSRRESD
jgi:hypothetical protein